MSSLRNAFAGIHQPPVEQAARKVRPAAKRGNPEFIQIGPYIRKSTKKAVDLRLIEQTGERDISGLVERLLIEWLAK